MKARATARPASDPRHLRAARRVGTFLLFTLLLCLPTARLTFGMPAASAAQPVPVQVLAQWNTTIGPCARTCRLLITSRRQLNQFWAASTTGSPPAVDFSRNTVVVAGSGGIQPGQPFTVTRMVRVGNQLQVHVRLGLTGPFIFPVEPSPSTVVLLAVPRPVTTLQFFEQMDITYCPRDLMVICQTGTGANPSAPAALVHPQLPCRNPVQPNDPNDDVACFGPGRVRRAEALLHPHGIDPSAAVTRLTNLHLHRVVVGDWAYYGLHPTWRPHLLIYLYGTAPSTMANLDFARHTPTFVEVAEWSVRPFSVPPSKPLIQQYLLHLDMTADPPSPGTIAKAPWELDAKIPHHKLWLVVAADGTPSTVWRIGLGVLHALG